MLDPAADRPAAAEMPAARIAVLAMLGFVLVAIAGVLLRPALPIDETRYLSVAWEMHVGGDYLVPHANGAEYSDKPPLLFWLINLVWRATGVGEVAGRLVAPALALGALGLTWQLARRLWPERPDVGPWAVAILASLSVFAVYGGLTMFDALLACWTLAALLALVAALERGGLRWWVAFGVAVGFGVLSKGPVILFHTLPALVLCRFWTPASGWPGAAAVLRGAAVALASALAVVAAWLGPALAAAGPDWREAVLWSQSAGRITQSFAHARAWWWFIALLPVLLFPWGWSPGLWRAVARLPGREPGVRLCLVWGGAALVLFSLTSGKQVHYLIPEFPAIALILARAREAGPRLRVGPPAAAMGLLGCLGLAAAAGVVALGDGAGLAQPPVALAVWALGLAALTWMALRLGGAAGIATLGLGLVLSLDLLIGTTQAREQYGGSEIAGLLADAGDDGIAVYGFPYNAEFNFAARLDHPVAEPEDPAALAAWVADHPGGRIVGRIAADSPDWSPRLSTDYRGRAYAVWFVADRPADPGRSGGQDTFGGVPGGDAGTGGLGDPGDVPGRLEQRGAEPEAVGAGVAPAGEVGGPDATDGINGGAMRQHRA